MINNFRYTLDSEGHPKKFGYDIYFGKSLTGEESFTGLEIVNYKKDLTTGEWKLRDELLYKYFLIPLDLVPNISHYAGFVKQTFPELIFDVVIDTQTVEVEGTLVQIPSKQIKFIPCSCTKWTEEGLQLLDAVIENWNVTYPNKTIDFNVKFESYEEFENFRNEQIQV